MQLPGRRLTRHPPDVGAPRYPAAVGVFPVDPADVPPAAVRAVRRTLLRHPRDGCEDELARYIVALVIAALAEPDSPGNAEQSLRLCTHERTSRRIVTGGGTFTIGARSCA